jgi:hypothetical protein
MELKWWLLTCRLEDFAKLLKNKNNLPTCFVSEMILLLFAMMSLSI